MRQEIFLVFGNSIRRCKIGNVCPIYRCRHVGCVGRFQVRFVIHHSHNALLVFERVGGGADVLVLGLKR